METHKKSLTDIKWKCIFVYPCLDIIIWGNILGATMTIKWITATILKTTEQKDGMSLIAFLSFQTNLEHLSDLLGFWYNKFLIKKWSPQWWIKPAMKTNMRFQISFTGNFRIPIEYLRILCITFPHETKFRCSNLRINLPLVFFESWLFLGPFLLKDPWWCQALKLWLYLLDTGSTETVSGPF